MRLWETRGARELEEEGQRRSPSRSAARFFCDLSQAALAFFFDPFARLGGIETIAEL